MADPLQVPCEQRFDPFGPTHNIKCIGHPFARDPTTFRYWVAQLWFVHYSRARGLPDTSGFEHIFMGETKNGEISGMHNWLRFYLLEKDVSENFDYKGFIVKRFVSGHGYRITTACCRI